MSLEPRSRYEANADEPSRKSLEARFDDVRIPPEIREFCTLKQIEDEVRVTIALARDHFAIIGEPEFQVVDDPESGAHYIGIHVQSTGRPEDVFRQSEAFLDSFLASIDSKKQIYINLIYHSTQE